MKREYKLEQKAGEIAQVAIIESSAIGVPNDHIEPWIKDFAIGVAVATAKWADSHPNWISVEDELPPKRKDPLVISDKVFIHTTGGHYLSAVYDYQDKQWIDVYNIETLESNEVTHWMPMPQPPRKED